MTVRGLVVIAALVTVAGGAAGCGTASDPSPPTGVDELTIPTPSPDPDDFVDTVDNPWLPLTAGRTWTYAVVDASGAHDLEVRVTSGPEVAGVPTTARVSTQDGRTTTDWFAQDTDGNVWWFGRAGEWTAGTGDAEAGLAMPAHPRIGDGYRAAYLPGVVEDTTTVVALTGSEAVPAGTFDDLLVTDERSALHPGVVRQRSWARGVGLVEEDGDGRTLRLEEYAEE
jgi:hypothetical protein